LSEATIKDSALKQGSRYFYPTDEVSAKKFVDLSGCRYKNKDA
jgi:hypothetical protein